MIKTIAVFAILLAILVSTNGQKLFENDWNQWKVQFSKSYSSDLEDDYRYSVFENNLIYINNHNDKNLSYTLGLNEYSDLDQSEISERFFGNVDTIELKRLFRKAEQFTYDNTVSLPDQFDWTDTGYVDLNPTNPICPENYINAAVSVLESAYAIQTNTPLQKFSRQQVLDCSYFKYKINGVIGNKGCKKGHDFHTFNYLKQYGAELATDYPSLGEVSNCKYQKNKVVANLSKIFTISSNPLLNLKALVSMLNKQPVLAYMYAPADFIHYKSGLYEPIECSTDLSCPMVNLRFVLLGYKISFETVKSFLKGSSPFGPSWGDNGSFVIPTGNVCCSQLYSLAPVI